MTCDTGNCEGGQFCTGYGVSGRCSSDDQEALVALFLTETWLSRVSGSPHGRSRCCLRSKSGARSYTLPSRRKCILPSRRTEKKCLGFAGSDTATRTRSSRLPTGTAISPRWPDSILPSHSRVSPRRRSAHPTHAPSRAALTPIPTIISPWKEGCVSQREVSGLFSYQWTRGANAESFSHPCLSVTSARRHQHWRADSDLLSRWRNDLS